MIQNTPIGNKATASPLHKISENIRESTEQVISDTASKTKIIAKDTAEKAGEFYDKASSWLQNNSGKALGMCGFLAIVGTAGYFVGRNHERSQLNQDQPRE